MNKDSPLAALDDFVKVLKNNDITYLLGGSFASSIQGDYRTTNDLDFLCQIPVDKTTQFMSSLQSDFIVDEVAVKNAILHRQSFNIFHEESFMKIDVFTEVGLYEKEQLARVVTVNIPGCSEKVSVCSPEDIIIAKMRWYQLGGKTSDRQLIDIMGVVKVQKNLDLSYMRTWADNLGLMEIFDQIIGVDQ